MFRISFFLNAILILTPAWVHAYQAAQIKAPAAFFGFRMGTNQELAHYSRVLEYLQELSFLSDRVQFRELGKTTLGNPYVLALFSSPENLSNLDRLVEINRSLADPRSLPPGAVAPLLKEGRVFYFLYATIHSTEIGNGQTIVELAHTLATSNHPQVEEILRNAVVLMVPSQNPDGQILVIDHYYKTKGTNFSRVFPDLYHPYTGHDDNRDWFMFTQKETLLNVEKVQNFYRPHVTHDMHQMASGGFRIFVPPFIDPYDRNIHPILVEAQAQLGLSMASALTAEGKEGVGYHNRFDMWTPARQYMVYHGQPRILTEIASVQNLTEPLVGGPIGPQEARWNYPVPYSKETWTLRDVVDYGFSAVMAGLTHVSKYRETWLRNFYKVHQDWVERREAPYAFVVPRSQRDPYATFELLKILEIADVEIQVARETFNVEGQEYQAGSWVIQLAQPYGAFAKTMLERQIYPDLRQYPGGPPIPPYDVTAHTLGLLMGVEVNQIDSPVEADLVKVDSIRPSRTPIAPSRKAFLIGPESNGSILAAIRLQGKGIPVFRSKQAFTDAGLEFAAGTWIIPASPAAHQVLEAVVAETGIGVGSTSTLPNTQAFELRRPTRIGLWKAANSEPGGWLKWLFEEYGIQHRTISSQDFRGQLSDLYDIIVLPSGTSKETIVQGLDPGQHDESWRWAYGVGETGWAKLKKWIEEGGHLVVMGSASETARQLLDLPVSGVLPTRGQTPSLDRPQDLKTIFQSPANLEKVLKERVVEADSVFYCPGSLLDMEYDNQHPVAYGMPERWPTFFRFDQAYQLLPGFGMKASVVSRYPSAGELLASGWLLGETLLRNRSSALFFEIGKGKATMLANQVAFRAQTRGTFKLLFNPIFHATAKSLSSREFADHTAFAGATLSVPSGK